MRWITLSLILAFGMSVAPLAIGAAQTPPDTTRDTTKKVKKAPSKLGRIAKGAVGTAATAAAGAGVQSLLGKKAGGVANALGAGGIMPCGTGYGVTAGAAIVGVAKGIVKKASDSETDPSAAPCGQAGAILGMPGGIPGMPAGLPGMPSGSDAGAAIAAAALGKVAGGANPLGGMGAVGALAGITPVGLAVSAAPGAIKGIKGLLGGKPQDKMAMLRELGKGKLELKDVKFIEGTAEMEPGFEASLAALGEALPLAEGKYVLYVAAEAGEKDAPPDTALQRKRIEKLWAAMLVGGVSDKNLVVLAVLPPELQEGRKAPKRGKARVELIRLQKQQ